jgi:phosphate acetyltransferase
MGLKMGTVEYLREKAKKSRALIILPEFFDVRVVKAARFIKKERIANIELLEKKKLSKQKIKRFAKEFYELRRLKGITEQEALKTVSDPLFYAAMMIRDKQASGFVAGASYPTPTVARAAIYCLGVDRRFGTASSSFIMVTPHCYYGENGTFVFADCGIVPDPSAETLANIAVSTAEMAHEVLGFKSRVAMLSYSTKASASGRLVQKVKEATALVKQKAPHLLVDGELQVDAAIVPEVAKIKYPDSKLKGRANILIFPNLEAGNIGYKLVQRLANARAIGPILQGIKSPCSDLSRGCSVDDIIDCVAVTAIRAKK